MVNKSSKDTAKAHTVETWGAEDSVEYQNMKNSVEANLRPSTTPTPKEKKKGNRKFLQK